MHTRICETQHKNNKKKCSIKPRIATNKNNSKQRTDETQSRQKVTVMIVLYFNIVIKDALKLGYSVSIATKKPIIFVQPAKNIPITKKSP